MNTTIDCTKPKGGKLLVALAAMLLALALMLVPQFAFASTPITGGDSITESGEYTLTSGSTGTINVGENLKVTINGLGSEGKFTGLNFEIGDGTELTINNLYAAQSTSQTKGVLDFIGSGKLIITGENLIDNDGGLNAAVIHVGKGNEVHFDGTGTLYGYKSALCSYIGGDASEANGKIVFDGGHWFIKGSKTGSVIGGDSTTVKGDNIEINGGELYCKGVARGALLGGSNQGLSGDVVVNGGLVELFQDFSGPAIGAGDAKNVGNVTINGGSLKTVRSSNSWASYGEPGTFVSPVVNTSGVIATGADNYQILPFNIADYAEGGVVVTVDGKPFYAGGVYTYVTNEVKNPDGGTKANWLDNVATNQVVEADYNGTAYPNKNGSWFAPENNLYFYLTKANHTMVVDGDNYVVTYDSTADAFTCVKSTWYDPEATELHITTAEEMAIFAQVVNSGTDSFAGKTIVLDNDITLAGEWAPIGGNPTKVDLTINSQDDLDAAIAQYTIVYDNTGASHNGGKHDEGYVEGRTYFYYEAGAFEGTFDGNGMTVSGLSITDGTGGYKGLFGYNAGTLKNFTINGAITLSAGADNIGGAVGFNAGNVADVTGNVAVTVTSNKMYAIGGIVGQNSGEVVRCINKGNVTAPKAAGGVVGRSYSTYVADQPAKAVISECANYGTITGTGGGKDQIGGIVGGLGYKEAVNATDGIVADCFNAGAVTNDGGKWVSGIAGFATKLTVITECYNVGVIGNPVSGAGGLIAYLDSNYIADFSDNFALDQAGYTGNQFGTRMSAEDMQASEFVIDLNNKVFNQDTDSINNGYPVFNWMGGTKVNLTAEDNVNRLAGDNRYETAAKIAVDAFETSKYAIVSTGANFPDALAASSLAGMLDCPVILTPSDSLVDAAAQTITTLGVTDVYIVGGENAVSDNVKNQITGLSGVTTVTRISGEGRFETAVQVYETGKGIATWSDTAIIATGYNFADALSISGYAFDSKAPIFLSGANGLDAQTQAAMADFSDFVIVGGTSAVSQDVENYLVGLVGQDKVTRLAGDNRYKTSETIALFSLANGFDANNASIATGQAFPDALAGGALVGKSESILLLADDFEGGLDALNVLALGKIKTVNALGGDNAVPNSVIQKALDIINNGI